MYEDYSSDEGYFGSFSDESDVLKQFEIKSLNGASILVAAYSSGSYEGYAFVLILRGSQLYEINASHCSCYRLEGQWDEEETDVASLEYRLPIMSGSQSHALHDCEGAFEYFENVLKALKEEGYS